MRRFAVDRIVAVSAAGVGEPKDSNLPALYRRLVKSTTLREVYADMERMEHEIMLSEMTWTIVRPAALTDGPFTGEYRVAEGRSLEGGKRISRADLAAFILKSIEIPLWDRKGVAIAY
jgi:putative NADH-flavin reductase